MFATSLAPYQWGHKLVQDCLLPLNLNYYIISTKYIVALLDSPLLLSSKLLNFTGLANHM